MMDCASAGHRGWSLILLDGSARTMLAGAVAPTEARGVALTVLSAAVRRDGVPVHLIAASGGACMADALAGVCPRLGMDHQPMVSTEGHSYMHLLETHLPMQRRLDDYPLAWTRTPRECAAAPQPFLVLYTTTAHQGLRQEPFASPLPRHVLGESQGRLVPPQERDQKFAHALFPRLTKRYGGVTWHRYHVYGDQGFPPTQVVRWGSGDARRGVFDTVVLAEDHCHYAGRHGKVTDIRDGRYAPTRLASPQGARLPCHPQECRGV